MKYGKFYGVFIHRRFKGNSWFCRAASDFKQIYTHITALGVRNAARGPKKALQPSALCFPVEPL